MTLKSFEKKNGYFLINIGGKPAKIFWTDGRCKRLYTITKTIQKATPAISKKAALEEAFVELKEEIREEKSKKKQKGLKLKRTRNSNDIFSKGKRTRGSYGSNSR